MDFGDLKKAQVLLNYWVQDVVAPAEKEKVEELVEFVLNGTTNEASILRNLVGVEGMMVIKNKRGVVIKDKMETIVVKEHKRKRHGRIHSGFTPQVIADIYSATMRARAKSDRLGLKNLEGGSVGRIARKFGISPASVFNIRQYMTKGDIKGWKIIPPAYAEAKKLLNGSQPAIVTAEVNVEPKVVTPRVYKARKTQELPEVAVEAWEVKLFGLPLISFGKTKNH